MQNKDHRQQNSDWITDNLPQLLKGIGVVAILLAIITVGFYLWCFRGQSVLVDPEPWGQLGDFFGGVLNPAFSFLALVGLLMTLHVQSKELQESRRMAADAQKEAKNSADALKAQNEAIHHQRFEQTFFAWLESYRSLINGLKHTTHRRRKDGSEVVYETSGLELINSICADTLNGPALLAQLRGRGVIPSTMEFPAIPNDQLGRVIGTIATTRRTFFAAPEGSELTAVVTTLEALLAWINGQPSFDERAKQQYAAIVRAQLSQIEQKLLLYVAVGPEWPELRKLVEQYHMLNIPRLCHDDLMEFLWCHRDRIILAIHDQILLETR